MAKGSSGVSVSKRFFSCPPPSSSLLPSGPRPQWHGARPRTEACGGGGSGSNNIDGTVSNSVHPGHDPDPPAAASGGTGAVAPRAVVTVRGAAAAGGGVEDSSAAMTAVSAAPEVPAGCSASMAPAALATGRGEVTDFFYDDDDNNRNDNGNGGEKEQAIENCPISLKEAGLGPGASICFFRAGCGGQGRAYLGRAYAEIAEELVQGMRELLQGRGALGRVHLLKVIATDATLLPLPWDCCWLCIGCIISFGVFVFRTHAN